MYMTILVIIHGILVVWQEILQQEIDAVGIVMIKQVDGITLRIALAAHFQALDLVDRGVGHQIQRSAECIQKL